jgi:thiol-disulfide isomerase/thioredoxin/uncharacterized membrane protein YphA (DoxX/SURF4 family)
MDVLLLTASIVLAVVFAVAGIAKLLDRAGSRTAARAFGVPDGIAPGIAVGLPLVELVVALLLLFSASRWWGALVALALFVLFSAAVARVMARGESPECHCFGQLHSAPADWRTLARNASLAGAAAFVVVAGRGDAGPGMFAWVSGLDGAQKTLVALGAALVGVLAGAGYVVLHVLRSYGHVLVRLDRVEERLRAAGFELEEPDEMPQLGLAPGTQAPTFWLPIGDGNRVALGDLLEPGHPVVLLFTSPTCEPCSVLMPEVARWQRELAGEVTIALLSDGDPEAIRVEAAEHGLVNVLVDEAGTAYLTYEVNGTPSAVLVSADGTIASWLAAGGDWIETLIQQALRGEGGESELPIGAEIPDYAVELLDGGPVSLHELIHGTTVLLFWNPSCGFCRSMHDDLASWEAEPPYNAPGLLVISAGEPEDIRAEGFACDVVVDRDWTLAAAFGANGTPMALLVDADRRVAAPLAAGGEQALGLLAPSARVLAE